MCCLPVQCWSFLCAGLCYAVVLFLVMVFQCPLITYSTITVHFQVCVCVCECLQHACRAVTGMEFWMEVIGQPIDRGLCNNRSNKRFGRRSSSVTIGYTVIVPALDVTLVHLLRLCQLSVPLSCCCYSWRHNERSGAASCLVVRSDGQRLLISDIGWFPCQTHSVMLCHWF